MRGLLVKMASTVLLYEAAGSNHPGTISEE
jgi:hypothetical protein